MTDPYLITPLHHRPQLRNSGSCPDERSAGRGGAGRFLPEESDRDSEPDDAGFLKLPVGMVRTAAGSTQSVARVETHCALLGLTAIGGTGEPAVCAAATLSFTFSSCLLAEKLLHMQSRMMMELRL